MQARLLRLIAWVISADGRKDIGAAVAACEAVYLSLHRAGVL